MEITISVDTLADLMTKSAELALVKAGVAGPRFVSKNKLEKIYGFSWVADKVEKQQIVGTRRGPAKNSTIKFDAAEVKAVWDAEQIAKVNL